MEHLPNIQLFNRDYASIWLEHVKDNWYKLNAENDLYLNYLRFGLDEDGKIYFVDPPGGPYLSLGDKLKDKFINKIVNDNGILIELT